MFAESDDDERPMETENDAVKKAAGEIIIIDPDSEVIIIYVLILVFKNCKFYFIDLCPCNLYEKR